MINTKSDLFVIIGTEKTTYYGKTDKGRQFLKESKLPDPFTENTNAWTVPANITHFEVKGGLTVEIRDARGLPGIQAPWTDDQVASLTGYQTESDMHPFTCGTPGCRCDLTATKEGWVCDKCQVYTQGWCHAFMADWSWRKK